MVTIKVYYVLGVICLMNGNKSKIWLRIWTGLVILILVWYRQPKNVIWNLHVNLSITISGIQTKQICRITKSKCSFRKDFTPIWTQVVEISKLQKPNFTILCCGWSAGCRGLVHRCSSLQLKVPQNNGFEVFMKLHSISIHPRIWHHVLYNQDS